jgi:hypothetical protein
MHAVVVRESGDPDKVEASSDDVAANVAPRVRQVPGFVSAVWMTDGAGRTLNVLIFDTEDAARGALERVRNAPRPLFMQVDSVDLYRVRAKA